MGEWCGIRGLVESEGWGVVPQVLPTPLYLARPLEKFMVRKAFLILIGKLKKVVTETMYLLIVRVLICTPHFLILSLLNHTTDVHSHPFVNISSNTFPSIESSNSVSDAILIFKF